VENEVFWAAGCTNVWREAPRDNKDQTPTGTADFSGGPVAAGTVHVPVRPSVSAIRHTATVGRQRSCFRYGDKGKRLQGKKIYVKEKGSRPVVFCRFRIGGSLRSGEKGGGIRLSGCVFLRDRNQIAACGARRKGT